MKKLYSLFNTSSDKESLGHKFRQRRMIFFNELISQLPKPLKVLDVGGSVEFWVNANYQGNTDFQITIINLTARESAYSNLKTKIGDATNLSEYQNNDFDLVFSNSVIEHLCTKENQTKMAKEILRVGKKHFIQTPSKYFFMEPHYLLPYFNFCPEGLKFFILTKTKLSRLRKWNSSFAKQYIEEIRLLSLKEMKELFPESIIWKEKFIGMNKSFVAHNITQKV